MRELVRTFTPLVLLVLCALVWLEPILPGAEQWREAAGETALLRLICGFLCLFVAILAIERRQLQSVFEQMLARLQQLQRGGTGETAATPDRKQLERDAAQILVAALDSDDARVRTNAVQNLERMTGQKFGEDVARWRKYLSERGE
ncbi:MAG: hypothetical protein KDB80_09250 [Planctomycetes bacterium]|nr:hypothetical protein [Planctomycetota bacterium]